MPAVARANDAVLSPDGSGKACRFPLKTKVGEVNGNNVYANGKLIVVQGNKVAPHTKSGCVLDESVLSSYSTKVFIGGKGIGRIGDQYGNNLIVQGSQTVFAG